LQLPKSFVAQEEKGLILFDRAPESEAVLTHSKWRDIRVAIKVIVVEIPRIEDGISEIPKCGSVPVIRSRLGDYVDLSAGLGAVLGVVQSAVDAVLLDSIL
jgi:hypothetical protein